MPPGKVGCTTGADAGELSGFGGPGLILGVGWLAYRVVGYAEGWQRGLRWEVGVNLPACSGRWTAEAKPLLAA